MKGKNLTAGLVALALTACVDVPTSALLEDLTPEAVRLPPGSCCITPAPPPLEEHEGDRRTLEAFYEAADGPAWTVQDGWLVDSVPLAEWAGVSMGYDTITGTLRVERLVMDPSNNLKGLTGIPKVLGELASLRVLDLRNARWGAGGALPRHLRPDGWVTYRPTAVPRELMGLPLDSLRLGFDGHCLPASDSALITWAAERENIPRGEGNYRVAPICLSASEIKGRALFVQGIAVHPDSLMYGRDTWVAYAPMRDTAALSIRFREDTRLNDSTRIKPGWGGYPPWPSLKVKVCTRGDCSSFPMSQGLDSLIWSRDGRFHFAVERPWSPSILSRAAAWATPRERWSDLPAPDPRRGWPHDVAAARVPGELIQSGTTIAVEARSTTHGDSVLLDRITVDPALERPLLRVVIVPIIQRNGEGHEWPDSAYDFYNRLRADETFMHEMLFAELEQWFPVRLEVRWHDEFHLGVEAPNRAAKDLAAIGRIRAASDDGDAYWLGLKLVGSCPFCGWSSTLGMAYQPGKTSIASTNGSVVAHEIGHNLGLDHPNDGCDPYNSGETCTDHRDKIRTLAFGEWIQDGTESASWWLKPREYHDTMRNPYAETFMQSVWSFRGSAWARSEFYPSIAPWQWQLIYREMVGEGTAADRQPVVVVN